MTPHQNQGVSIIPIYTTCQGGAINVMDDCRKGTVIIKSKKEKGLFKKRTVYGGVVKACPSVYGYSLNEEFKKEYHRGDEVNAEYYVYTGGKKDNYDEFIEFLIIEE